MASALLPAEIFGSRRRLYLLFALIGVDMFLLILSVISTQEQLTSSSSPPTSLTLICQKGDCYRQLELDNPVAGLPKGQHRFTPDEKSTIPLPLLSHTTQSSPVVLLLSKGNKRLPQQTGKVALLFYDNWEKRDHRETSALLKTADNQQFCVLLDNSGTMSEPQVKGEVTSRLTTAATHLLDKRRLSGVPWNVFTFSEKLHSHGVITRNGLGTFYAQLPSPHGTTALLSALQQLITTLSEPADIVVISDGLFTERDTRSVKDVLGRIRGKGHELYLLSPSLAPLERAQWLYSAGIVKRQWPSETPLTNVSSTTVSFPSGRTIPWYDIPSTQAGKGMTPLLFSETGETVVYLSNDTSGVTLHIIGRPGVPSAELAQLFSRYWKNSPVVVLRGDTCIVDIHSATLATLRVSFGAEWSNILPLQPGIYSFDRPINGWNEVSLFHPLSGPFTISGLSHFNPFRVYGEKAQSLVSSNGQASPYLYLTESTFIVLLALLHLIWILWVLWARSSSAFFSTGKLLDNQQPPSQ